MGMGGGTSEIRTFTHAYVTEDSFARSVGFVDRDRIEKSFDKFIVLEPKCFDSVVSKVRRDMSPNHYAERIFRAIENRDIGDFSFPNGCLGNHGLISLHTLGPVSVSVVPVTCRLNEDRVSLKGVYVSSHREYFLEAFEENYVLPFTQNNL